jgi:uncharacterized protein (DUF1697 family)
MADLKGMFINNVLNNPVTYIQSGNVIFESEFSDCKKNEIRISKAILNTFGYDVTVIVKTASELSSIINNNPFLSDLVDPKQLHVTFLGGLPTETDVLSIESLAKGNDKFLIDRQTTYVNTQGAYHKTKLSNQFFEKKLKVSTTTRNWKTTIKLLEITNS